MVVRKKTKEVRMISSERNKVEKIFKSFLKLSATKRGEISAQLISSKSLSSEDLKNIKSELSKVAGLEINFEYKIDREFQVITVGKQLSGLRVRVI